MKNSSHLRFTASALLALMLVSSAGLSKERLAEIESDKLVVLHEHRMARFVGSVRANYKSLKLACDEMEVSYDDNGQVIALLAKGRVVVRSKDGVARAGHARLDAKTDRLILSGSPTLTRGPHRLSGSRIEISLATFEVHVQDARGTFEFERKKR